MKTSCPSPRRARYFALFLFWAAAAASLRAQSAAPMNPYDALGRVLVPIASLFSNAPHDGQHALSATLVLEAMTGLPPEWAGSRVDLALEPPERVLVRVPGLAEGGTTTFCRVGQEIWIAPGSRFAALAASPAADGGEPMLKSPKHKKKGKKAKREEGLAPLALPFPPQQLALLPVLFTVKEGGEAAGMRILDVRLMPELARGLGVEEWSARLFLDSGKQGAPGEPRLARVELSHPGWHIAVRVERLEFFKELPASTWTPPSDDVVRLTGKQARQWVETLADRISPPRTK